MGLLSFLGRVLFASFFMVSAWRMFIEAGEDGGPVAKELAPKVAGLQNFFEFILGKDAPNDVVNLVVALFIVLKGLGGLLFVFGSLFGAVLLCFYLILALLYGIPLPNFGEPQSLILLEKLQNVAFLGAMLFYIDMKKLLNQRQPKKMTRKPKTT